MKMESAPSMNVAAISPPSTTVVNGKIAKRELARLPKKVYVMLYREAERVRKLPAGERLAEGAELLTVIFELNEVLEAVQIAIRGALELKTKPEE